MKNIGSLVVLGAFVAIYSCNAIENGNNKLANEENIQKFDTTDIKADVNFVTEVVSSDMMELQVSNLALNNCTQWDVRQFVQKVIDDNTGSNTELVSLARARNISLPLVPDNYAQTKLDFLKQKKGAQFDKYYITMIINDHKNAISFFHREMDAGNDPEIKAWAYKKMISMQTHLEMAEAIQKKMDL